MIFQPSIFGPSDQLGTQLPPVILDQTIQSILEKVFIQTVVQDEEGPGANIAQRFLLIGEGNRDYLHRSFREDFGLDHGCTG